MQVYVGYDERQPIAYNVLQHSIVIRSTEPVTITPLIIQQLPLQRRGLTPFTFTRFLVPYLMGYQGVALFLDCDMMVDGNITELFDQFDPEYAVQVVKSEHKFEWASVMLFNCGHPGNKILTPEYIETAEGLHTIKWTDAIGDLPAEWNHLVMYDQPRSDAKLVHFTCGIPVHPATNGTEYTSEYMEDLKFLTFSQPWETLMGNSVHVGRVEGFNRAKAIRQQVEKGSAAAGPTRADGTG